jgi:L,D-transpeptidase ErfK/SrfK
MVENNAYESSSTKPLIWRFSSFRRLLIAAVCLSAVLATLVLLSAPTLREWALFALPAPRTATKDNQDASREIAKLKTRVASLKQQFDKLIPSRPYLVVDTSNNHVYLMSGKKVLHDAVCSTGSYVHLKAGDDRHWVFKTPRGRFFIQKKEESPVWHKPDWAFIEEGLPVPPKGAKERYETGVLGDYALHLGDGYLIHGTLYTRLLGMPVTHGCVRLDDETLSIVYRKLAVGSAVFIY